MTPTAPLGCCRLCGLPVVADPFRRPAACDLDGRWVHCDCRTRVREPEAEPAPVVAGPTGQLALDLAEGAA